MMNAVGGTTLHYWAQSWRLNPWDFKVVSETTRRYGASRIPKGSTVEDWPFGLEELEPYYDKVEYEIGVSGQAGNIKGAIDARGNIFEGPRSARLPDAAVARHRVHRDDGQGRRSTGLASVPRPGSDQLAQLPEPHRMRLSRFLQSRRLSCQREGVDGGHDDSEAAGDRKPHRRD